MDLYNYTRKSIYILCDFPINPKLLAFTTYIDDERMESMNHKQFYACTNKYEKTV
jgi:hypothetical protein